MDCMNLIRRAREVGLRITTDGSKLSVRGPVREQALVQDLLARKIEIIAILQLERQKSHAEEPLRQTEEYQDPAKDDGGCLAEPAASSIQESGQDTLQKVSLTQLTVDTTDKSDTTGIAEFIADLAESGWRCVHGAETDDGSATPLAPERRQRLEGQAAKLAGEKLFDFAHDIELPEAERRLYRDAIRSRMGQVLDELDGAAPRSNPGVDAMLTEALARFGTWSVNDRSLTAWLRKHAPQVAALWPDAPVDAAWFDWRRKTGPEHMATLDEAWRTLLGLARCPWEVGQ